MSLKCPICKTNVELGSFTDIRDDIYNHLNGHEENGAIMLSFLIQTDYCLSRLTSIRHYVDHLNFSIHLKIEQQKTVVIKMLKVNMN